MLVRVLAAGVSLPDIMAREGLHPRRRLPLHARVGSGWGGGSAWRRRLWNRTRSDSCRAADPRCLRGVRLPPPRELVPVPSGLDAAEAVSLVLNYITAYQMLVGRGPTRPARVSSRRGRGVGTALLQLGRVAGLEMSGTCSSRSAPAVSDLGGIPIDYQDQDFVKETRRLTSEGVDVVFDPSVVPTSGIPARLSVLAGRWWAMAFVPRYVGRDWLQVGQAVVSASGEPPSSGCTSPAAGFFRPQTGGALQHPDAQTAET